MSHRIVFPRQIEITSCDKILATCSEKLQILNQEILLDLSNTVFIRPFGVTYLSCLAHRLYELGNKIKFRPPTNSKTKKYLIDIKFYNIFQMQDNIGPNPRETSIEIRRLDPHYIDYSYIESLIAWLSTTISMSEALKAEMRNIILEMITNSQDHSNCQFGCYVCAQIYPQRKEIELSIMDFGVGIPANLRPIYAHLQNDAEAVEYSLESGISSRSGMGAKGTGLNILKSFISSNKGSLDIYSYGGIYRLNKSKGQQQLSRHIFPGTSFCIKMRIDDQYYMLSDEVEEYF